MGGDPAKYLIYALSEPDGVGEVRYIGKSCSGLKRPRRHTSPCELVVATYKNNWIKSLLSRGVRPVIEVVQEFDTYTPLNEAERFWIVQFRALGFRLTNGTDGGEGVPEGKSFRHRGRKASEATRQKMSLAQSKRSVRPPHTEEAKRKMSLAAVGRRSAAKYSDEQLRDWVCQYVDLGRSFRQISKETGAPKSSIMYELRRLGVKSRPALGAV